MASGSEQIGRSWTETQALATRAAEGAGVPAAQALAFGAMLVRHLADGGAEAALRAALEAPERIVTLAQQAEEVIEAASTSSRPSKTLESDADQRALLASWLGALPCAAAVDVQGDAVLSALDLTLPSKRKRSERLVFSEDLYEGLKTLAARTYVPDSEASRVKGAGASQMEID